MYMKGMIMAKDNEAFMQALSFMYRPSAAGAKQMKGIIDKQKKQTISQRRKRTMTGMSMSNGLGNGGTNVQTIATKY